VNASAAGCGRDIVVLSLGGIKVMACDRETREITVTADLGARECLPSGSTGRYPGVLSQFCAVLPDSKLVVASAPWLDAFVVSGYGKKRTVFRADPGAARVSAIAVGDPCVVVTGSVDSTVAIYDISGIGGRVRYVVGHADAIIDVALSTAADLVVSCDADKVLVAATVSEGRFVFSKRFATKPSRVFVCEIGLTLVAFQVRGKGGIETEIVALDMAGREVGRLRVPLGARAWRLYATRDRTEFLAVGAPRCLYVYRCYDLALVAKAELAGIPVCIAHFGCTSLFVALAHESAQVVELAV